MALRSMLVIASLLWPGLLSRPEPASLHPAWGDVATWVLAAFALGALIAAGMAYGQQRTAVADQRTATTELAKQATALADQVEEQRKANALQAKVLQQQLGVLVRQQAELIGLEHSTFAGEPTGLRSARYRSAKVTNGSGRPVRSVVCRLQTQQGGSMNPARNVVEVPGPSMRMFVKPAHDDKIRLLRQGETWMFVFPVESDSQAILTLRFTDDAGLHWQVDDDLHLEQLPERDW